MDDSEFARLEWDRDFHNAVDCICGYIAGKSLGLIFVLAAIGWQSMGSAGISGLITSGFWPLAKLVGCTGAAVVFVRVGLPLLARQIYRASPKRQTPGWVRYAPVVIVGLLVVFAGWMVSTTGVAPAAGAISLFSTGFAGAFLWGGLRFRKGTDRFCGRCGYQMDTLPTQPRCPECGSDWQRPWRTRMGRRVPNARMLAVGIALVLVTIVLVAVAARTRP